MNVYFACSITGGRQDEGVYAELVQALLATGHQVPTAANAQLGAGPEADHTPAEVYARDAGWIDACDALVAEVGTPSHGVGYEISYALERGKPVLCLHHRDVTISKMLSGNRMPGLRVESYANVAEAVELIKSFLQEITPSG